MVQTIFLAKFVGIFLLILGVSMTMKRKMVTQIIHDLFGNRTLTYFVGLMEFIGGLLFVLYHNLWGSTLETVITIFGWLLLIEGVLYMLMSRDTMRKIISRLHSAKVYYFLSIVYLIIGAIVAYQGFSG